MARTATGCDPAAPGAGPTARLARPAAMLFDWHGTLVDTLDVMYRSIEHMLQRLPELDLIDRLVAEQDCHSEADARLVHYVRIFRRLPPRVLAERRVSRTDIFDALFGRDRPSITRAHAAYDEAYRRFFGAVRPFEAGVRNHLQTLAALGIRLGVATNRRREFLAAELERVEPGGWESLFAVTVAGDEVEHRKPHPAPLLRALERLGMPAGRQVWYVGDSVADMLAAHAAGLSAVFYNGADWPADWFEQVFPDPTIRPEVIVDDFDALMDLVAESAACDDPGSTLRIGALRPARRARAAVETVDEPAPGPWNAAGARLAAPEGVLFDWHATLVDTLDAMYRAVDDTLPELAGIGLMKRLVPPELSRSIDDQKLLEYVRGHHELHPRVKAERRISRTDIFEVLFGGDEDAKRVAHETFTRHYRTHFGAAEPFEPHVRDVLVALRRLGLKVGVITNRDREFFVQELAKVEGTGWAGHFQASVCGDDTPRRKPHPDPLLLAAANLGLAPGAKVWYVGDSTTDVIAAREAGMTAVFFNGARWDAAWLHKIFPGSERHPHQPDVVVDNFSEFFALVLASLDQVRQPSGGAR